MDVIFKLSLVVLLVFLNSFFVASEFSLVSLRKTRIRELADRGDRRAKIILKALANLDHYISATQFGITLASLALGWIGEPALARFLEPWFAFLPPTLGFITTHTIAVIVAFSLITFLHIIVGELAPKSVAIQRSEKVAFIIIAPLIIFTQLFNPFIWFLNKSGQLLLKVLGFNTADEGQSIHSEEEVKMILAQSSLGGMIPEDEVKMVYKVFQLGDTSARKVMIPRKSILALNVNSSLKEVVEKIDAHPHSRFPVYETTLDNIIGFIHVKDIYRELIAKGEEATIKDIHIIRKIINVTDIQKLDTVMDEMQAKRTHLAVVKNDHGSTVGIISLEDVIESLVGEIEDEFDPN